MKDNSHIILIEPDLVIGTVYKTALEDRGYSVEHANSAEKAIAGADEMLPQLVILEPQMARHNGIEFLYEFRSYTEWRDVPVIILTNLATEIFGDYAVLRNQLGVVVVLEKAKTSLARLVDEVDKQIVASKL